MKFVGIDPGRYGAIAMLEGDKWTWHLMPVLEVKKGRFDLDLHEVVKIIGCNIQKCPSPEEGCDNWKPYDMLAIEEPPYIPSNGGFAIRSLSKSFGNLQGICVALGINPICPGPKVWKAAILPGKSKDKEAAIAYVKTVYPDIQLPKHPKYPKKDHDGVADAVCIADYARMWYYTKGT